MTRPTHRDRDNAAAPLPPSSVSRHDHDKHSPPADSDAMAPCDTRVIKTLWPGQPGTIKLCRQFGPNLVCVRYRRDAAGLRRYTTAEVIVSVGPIKDVDKRLYALKINPHNLRLRLMLMEHGAKWNAKSNQWLLTGKTVAALNLQHRVRPAKKNVHG